MASISQVFMEEKVKDFGGDVKKILANVSSDSNSSSAVIQAPKRQKLESNTNSSSFKGVVLQPNGHWGAQIYANHQRIWLGTFKTEKEAAMAYDSASIKVRGWDLHRNIPWTNITILEPGFQKQFSTEIVMHMIKDGSYVSKFLDYVQEQSGLDPNISSPNDKGLYFKKLFNKELTPSDVSRLNRLVIPKKYALMHFPVTPDGENNNAVDTEIVCKDRSNVEWKFRFCYWKSSQSFVFTRGWNGFVKAKRLRAKDIITFFSCENKNYPRDTNPSLVIHVEYNNGFQDDQVEKENQVMRVLEEEKDLPRKESSCSTTTRRGFRLFGVQIVV